MNNNIKKIILLLLVGACILLLLAVNLELETDIIYTHVFYLPILLAVFWFEKEGIYLAIFLSLLHLMINYSLYNGLLTGPVLRSVFLVLFALVANFLLSRLRTPPNKIDTNQIYNNSSSTTLEPITQRNLIGNMALTIGDELRNSMTSTKAFIQLFNNDTDSDQKEYSDIVIDEINKTNETLNDYILLGSNVSLSLEPVNLSTLVYDLEPIIIELGQPLGIVFEKNLSNIPDLLLDKKQITKLLLHLVRNAIEAMPSGGKLIIKSNTDTNRVIISVQDQGPGIEPDIAEKIGTPFVTTKESHNGLGLAICYSILFRHNATIEFISGKSGTIFNCIFPIT